MPVHDLGYRAWTGDRQPPHERWWVIAEVGIRLAWRSTWLRRLLLLAWLPAVYCGLAFFMFENAAKSNIPRNVVMLLSPQFRFLPQFETVAAAVSSSNMESARHQFWAWTLWIFFRHPQGIVALILVGLVAPGLISQDLRTKAYLIYFSRPISAWEYVLGKATVLVVYLSLLTVAPALTLYVLGVLLSPDLSVLRHTWDLPLRIVAASAIVIIPTTSLALCYSSLTRETRYAGFAWFATCILGWVAYAALSARDFGEQGMAGLGAASGRWMLLSLYHTLGRVENWVFGLESDPIRSLHAAYALTILTVLSLSIVLRRVTSPIRV